jgi:hypothetical protein
MNSVLARLNVAAGDLGVDLGAGLRLAVDDVGRELSEAGFAFMRMKRPWREYSGRTEGLIP